MTSYIYISVFSILIILFFFLPLSIFISGRVSRMLNKNREENQPKKKWLARLVFISLMLIPTWDVIVGSINLNLLCVYKGGAYVNEKVYVDGFLFKTDRLSTKKLLADYGFKFIEDIERNYYGDKYVRYSLKNGVVEKQYVTQLKSEYERSSKVGKKITRFENPFNVDIALSEMYVKNIKTEQKIGGYKEYYFGLGWIEKIFYSGFPGSSVYCNETPYGSKKRPLYNFNLDTLYPRKE